MTSPDTTAHVRFARRNTNGIALHVAEAGPESGPLVILLHGFPEFWYGWRRQIPALAGSGYWVVAPDQRGYNLSDKPRGIAAYDLDRLAADITGLPDSVGRRRFSIVGHDWGALVGWWIASLHPDRVERLAVLNAPHPVIWRRAMRDDPKQRRKSWYVRAFRVPWLPEFTIRRQNFKALEQALRDTRRADTNSEADLTRYRAAWSQPGALTAMLNWYRAYQRRDLLTGPLPHIKPRTLIIWGTDEKFAVQDLAEKSRALCMQGSVSYLDSATHWVQHDEPDRVNALLLEFLR